MSSPFKTLLAATALMAAASGMAHAETLRVGFSAEPYPPFTAPDANGNWTGWEIEITQAICAKIGAECELVPTAWDGIIPALTSERIDMIFGSMSITEQRKQTIDFSDPYYRSSVIIVGPKEMEFEATPEGLADKVIGVQSSTIHQVYADKYFVDADIQYYQTQEEANQDLISGRIDATQGDMLAMSAFMESASGQQCCESKGSVASDPQIFGGGVGVGLRKGSDELRERINEAIVAIRDDGTYDEITGRYFEFDIYGE